MRNEFFSLRFAILAVTGLFTVVGSGAAQAQYNYDKSAPSGRSQWIDSYMGWNADCSHKTAHVDIVEQPSHGRVSPRIEIRKIEAAQIGTLGACRGKPVEAVSVYYKSNRGYSGTDSFKVRMRLDFTFPVTYTYRIKVK